METAPVEPAQRLRTLIGAAPAQIDDYLATLSGTDVLRAMFRLDHDERHAVLVALAPETAAEFIEDVPDEVAADLIEALPSGPVLTTVTDMCGFFLLLGSATLAIAWL